MAHISSFLVLTCINQQGNNLCMSDLTTSTDWLDVAPPSSEDDDLSLSFPDPLDKSHFESALESHSNASQATDDCMSDADSTASTNRSNHSDSNPKHESLKTSYKSTPVESKQSPESLSSSSRTVTDCSGTLTAKVIVLTQSNDLQQFSDVMKKAFIKCLFDTRPGFVTEGDSTNHIVNANNPDCCFPVSEQEWRLESNYFHLHYQYINISGSFAQDEIFKILLENLPTIIVIPANEGIDVFADVLKLRSKLQIVIFDSTALDSGVDENKITLKELTDHTASQKMKRIYEGIENRGAFADTSTARAVEPVSREKGEDAVKVKPKVSAIANSLDYLFWSFKYTCSILGLVLTSMLAFNTYRLASEGNYDLNWLSGANQPTAIRPAISSAPCSYKPSLSLRPKPSVNNYKTIDQAKTTTEVSVFNQVFDVVARIPSMTLVKDQLRSTDASEKDSFNNEDWMKMTGNVLNNAYFMSLYYVGDHIRQVVAIAETILELTWIVAEIGYENVQKLYENLMRYAPSFIQKQSQDIGEQFMQTFQQISSVSRGIMMRASRNANRLLRGSKRDHSSLNKRARQTSEQWESTISGGYSHFNDKTYRQMKRAKNNYKRTFSKFV
ncbi:hypothetical protein E3P96_02294 [Wallemia ichthyophaga]|nr:hypothetical protein E3P96_02294 [Wallemia ichthyophaga]